jgi:hypothetical protein
VPFLPLGEMQAHIPLQYPSAIPMDNANIFYLSNDELVRTFRWHRGVSRWR